MQHNVYMLRRCCVQLVASGHVHRHTLVPLQQVLSGITRLEPEHSGNGNHGGGAVVQLHLLHGSASSMLLSTLEMLPFLLTLEVAVAPQPIELSPQQLLFCRHPLLL